jgi:hypothetical protein
MKIELQTIGRNKLTAISLVKQFGGVSLITATELVEDLPSEFSCTYPYEKLDEILDAFTQAGCRISIETGHTKEKEGGSEERKIIRLLFSKSKKTKKADAEKVKLTNKDEVLAFMKNRQDYPKAVGTGVLAVLAVWLLSGFFFFREEFVFTNLNTMLINILSGLLIAFAIRVRGRGVEVKFGMAAATLSIAGALGIYYVNRASHIYLADYPVSYLFETFKLGENWFTASLIISAFLAYFTAFERINEEPTDDNAFLLASNAGVSDFSGYKAEKMKKEIVAPHADYFKLKEKRVAKAKSKSKTA